jgi:hypothetical protein
VALPAKPKKRTPAKSPNDVKAKKSFSYNDLVTVTQDLTVAWRQPLSPVNKSPIGRAQILKKVLAVPERDTCMTAGYFCFGIVCVQVNIRKDPTISIPASDLGLNVA